MIFKKSNCLVQLTIVGCVLLFSSCYSFRSSLVDAELKTYYVENFKVTAYNAPATINQTFAEALKDKIARESSLKYNEENPDIEFTGTIQSYNVTGVAPQPNEQTAFNRLTISVNIDYINHLDNKKDWVKSFSHFEDFASTENLLDKQEELIDVIFKQILEDVFNQAFNNW